MERAAANAEGVTGAVGTVEVQPVGEGVIGAVQLVRTEVEEFYAPPTRNQVDPAPVGGILCSSGG